MDRRKHLLVATLVAVMTVIAFTGNIMTAEATFEQPALVESGISFSVNIGIQHMKIAAGDEILRSENDITKLYKDGVVTQAVTNTGLTTAPRLCVTLRMAIYGVAANATPTQPTQNLTANEILNLGQIFTAHFGDKAERFSQKISGLSESGLEN